MEMITNKIRLGKTKPGAWKKMLFSLSAQTRWGSTCRPSVSRFCEHEKESKVFWEVKNIESFLSMNMEGATDDEYWRLFWQY